MIKYFAQLDLTPTYASEGANGLDLRASVGDLLLPRERLLVSTGLRFELEYPQCMLILPRSGLAYKYGITVLNAPGLIDSDYRGEIKVLLINHGERPFAIEPGMRVAQGLIINAPQSVLLRAPDLGKTERGDKGFGSTGAQ